MKYIAASATYLSFLVLSTVSYAQVDIDLWGDWAVDNIMLEEADLTLTDTEIGAVEGVFTFIAGAEGRVTVSEEGHIVVSPAELLGNDEISAGLIIVSVGEGGEAPIIGTVAAPADFDMSLLDSSTAANLTADQTIVFSADGDDTFRSTSGTVAMPADFDMSLLESSAATASTDHTIVFSVDGDDTFRSTGEISGEVSDLFENSLISIEGDSSDVISGTVVIDLEDGSLMDIMEAFESR